MLTSHSTSFAYVVHKNDNDSVLRIRVMASAITPFLTYPYSQNALIATLTDYLPLFTWLATTISRQSPSHHVTIDENVVTAARVRADLAFAMAIATGSTDLIFADQQAVACIRETFVDRTPCFYAAAALLFAANTASPSTNRLYWSQDTAETRIFEAVLRRL